MTVYADSLFLVNFLSEYALLLLTEKIISVKARKFRKGAAAVFGALLSVIIFCTDIPLPQSAITLAAAFLIVCAAYIGNKRAVLRAYPAFLLISCIYSGIITAVSGFLNINAVIRSGMIYMSINTMLFVIIFICTYPAILLGAQILNPHRRKICKISVSYGGKSVTINALYDSGNLLCDGAKGVIIAEWDAVKPLFDIEDMYEIDGAKILPFGSLGGCRTVLVFYADKIGTENNNFENVPIGIVRNRISQNGSYRALIGKQYF